MTVTYVGDVSNPMDWQAWIELEGGARQRLPLRLDICNHSPDGFAWGYGGSGPAQLALALIAHAVGPEMARKHYQDFKWQRIARLEQNMGWRMSAAEVIAWVKAADAGAPTTLAWHEGEQRSGGEVDAGGDQRTGGEANPE